MRKVLVWFLDILIVCIFVVCMSSFGGLLFEFDATSQFLVFDDRIEEYHVLQSVRGFSDVVVLGSDSEGSEPLVFRIDRWVFVDDSTMIGYGHGHIVEWQRRCGEQAIVATIRSAAGVFDYHAYEFWRDSTQVR
jgi:hypothetical protein